MRRLRPGLVLWLTVVWVGLWGDVSAANVLGGLAVALGVTLLLPLEDVELHGRISPVGVVRFAGVFLLELVRASVQVAVLVLRPRTSLRSAVLAVPVHGRGDRLLTLVGNSISLTPGTLTLEVDREAHVLHVHVLDVGDDVEQVRRDIARLERAAARALGQAHEQEVRQGQERDARTPDRPSQERP